MTRLSSQRGISLMLLIIAVTVFAGVAIGVVTLLRSRHESYAYQVQSYQVYALAHAGIEFAIQLAKDNKDPNDPNSFVNHPEYYIPIDGTYKAFKFGNGWFALKYARGCAGVAPWGSQDALYSRGCLTQPGTDGTCPGATREIQLGIFSQYANPSDLFISGIVTRTPYRNAGISGDRIEFNWCDPRLMADWATNPSDPTYAGTVIEYTEWPDYERGFNGATRIAAYSDNGQPVYLARIAFITNTFPSYPIRWLYDMACGFPINNSYGGANTICNETPSYDYYHHPVAPYTPFTVNYNGVSSYYQPWQITSDWNGMSTPTINASAEYQAEYNYISPPVGFGQSQLKRIPWNTGNNTLSQGYWDGAKGRYVNYDNANRPQIPYNQYTNPAPTCDYVVTCPPFNCPGSPAWAEAMCEFYQEGQCWDEHPSPMYQQMYGGQASKYVAMCTGGNASVVAGYAQSGNGHFIMDTLGPLPIDASHGVTIYLQIVHKLAIYSGHFGAPNPDLTWNYKFRIDSTTPTCTISPTNPLCLPQATCVADYGFTPPYGNVCGW